jgi:hypothetical protein
VTAHAVHDAVLRYIADPAPADFEGLALEVFAHQFECIPAYRRVCERRGKTPETVRNWRAIPAVPTLAFKEIALRCGPAERTFVTTGTTQGRERRGEHGMPDLRLYRAAALGGLRAFVFPDLEAIRVLSLIPTVAERPDSSLAQMGAWALEAFGSAGSAAFAHAAGFDFDGLGDALRRSGRDGEPVCIMTTTGALIRFLDHCGGRGWTFRLPHGSRLMDTGGAKGAPRVLSRNGLLHACWSTLAIPGYFVANEYGMTELSSQFYDNVIRDRHQGRHTSRAKAGPPWLRARVLDPATLDEVPEGHTGLLCHTDLANAATALVVLTEDLGRVTSGGFEILGRVAGAEARGCSLAAAEFVG